MREDLIEITMLIPKKLVPPNIDEAGVFQLIWDNRDQITLDWDEFEEVFEEDEMEPRLAINNDQGPGPPFPTQDWVTSLPVGTKFLCQDKKTKDILELEILARSPKKYIYLIDHGDASVVWHDPWIFSHQKDFLDLLEG